MAVFSGKWSVFLQRLQLLVALARAPFLLLALPSIGLAIAWCQTQAAAPVSFTDSLLVLLAAVAAQVSVNAFNEYEDFCSGLDQTASAYWIIIGIFRSQFLITKTANRPAAAAIEAPRGGEAVTRYARN